MKSAGFRLSLIRFQAACSCTGSKGALTTLVVTVSFTLSDGTIIQASKAVVVATGSFPRQFGPVEFDGEVIMSSDHVLNIDHAPQKVAIIGGGLRDP